MKIIKKLMHIKFLMKVNIHFLKKIVKEEVGNAIT